MKRSIKIIILLFIINYLPYVALAQFELPSLDIAPTLKITADPATPQPNSTVVVTANVSGTTNTNNLTYTWFLNGARQSAASGVNKNYFGFKAGELGSVYSVSVSISTTGGNSLSDSVSLTVSDFDLTWSANTQAPSGYRGKLLPTHNSIVIVSALPMIYRPGTKNLISSNSLIYNWSVNNKFQQNKSGTNNYALNFKPDIFSGDSALVGLEIKTDDGSVSIKKSVTIPIVLPQNFIYFSDSPTSRPYGIALRDLVVKSANFNFIAEGYFFNVPRSQLKWQWMVDNNEIAAATDQPWLATLNIAQNLGQQFFTRIRAKSSNIQNQLETSESVINLEIR